jgi:tetratricopeptide (TPR) repeat protein
MAMLSIPAVGSISGQIQSGLDALAKGQFDEAREVFSLGFREAVTNKDKGTLHFYQGLALQKRVEVEGRSKPDRVNGWLGGAQRHYEEATRLIPDAASVWNNLAAIYEQRGDRRRATGAFEKAIRLADERQVLYMVNYADFLLKTRKVNEAVRYYKLALEVEPTNGRAQRALTAHYMSGSVADLGDYLRDLLDQGRALTALDSAIAVLMGGNLKSSEGRELLTIVAMCLTRLSNQPEDFLSSSQAARLRGLITPGGPWEEPVREIFNLYHRRLQPMSHTWWGEQMGSTLKAPRGGWPLEAFHSLIRSLGDQCVLRGNLSTAEAYYTLALNISWDHPDARALVKLADIYVRSKREAKLKELLQQGQETLQADANVEDRMYIAKDMAIRDLDIKRRYEFHRALGIVYGHLGQWGDRNTVRSAAYQLHNAIEAAQRYNDRAKTVKGAKLIIEPRLVGVLAGHYKEKGQEQAAFTLRTEVVDNYRKLGAAKAATQIFRPIANVETPSGADRNVLRRYEVLKKDFGQSGFSAVQTKKPSLVGGIIRTVSMSQPRPASVKKRTAFGTLTLMQPKGGSLQKGQMDTYVEALESLLLQEMSKRADRGNLIVLPKDFPERVCRVEIEDGLGKMVLDHKSQPVEVPFTVERTTQPKGMVFRAVRVR